MLAGVCRLSASSVVLCNAAGGRAAAEGMGGRVADTARRASTVTSPYGDTLFC